MSDAPGFLISPCYFNYFAVLLPKHPKFISRNCYNLLFITLFVLTVSFRLVTSIAAVCICMQTLTFKFYINTKFCVLQKFYKKMDDYKCMQDSYFSFYSVKRAKILQRFSGASGKTGNGSLPNFERKPLYTNAFSYCS